MGKQITHDLRKSNGKDPDKWASALNERTRGKLTWADADAEGLLSALVAATEDGAALLLSKTSDGGALSIHVLTGAGTHKLYPAAIAELHEALDMIERVSLGTF